MQYRYRIIYTGKIGNYYPPEIYATETIYETLKWANIMMNRYNRSLPRNSTMFYKVELHTYNLAKEYTEVVKSE